MPSSRLSLRGLSKSFGATRALDRVSLEAGPGEVHALIGENGAGKSTLLRILAGVVAPEGGEMRLDDRPYRPRGPADARDRGLAMVHQELAVCPDLDVAANVVLGIEPARFGFLDGSRAGTLSREALRRAFGDHPVDPRALLASLSVAERQLVEIARALATARASGEALRVLVLDEPTSSLGARDAERLLALVRELAAEGTTVLYVTHALDEVARVASRFTVLRDGVSVASGDVATTSAGEMVRQMAGREVAASSPRVRAVAGEVVVSARALGGARLPIDATFELRRGEVLGVAGLVGAGRTELLRAIFGLDPVRRGELRVGTVMGPRSPRERWARGMGFASEDRKGEGLALSSSVAENLTLSRLGPSGPRLPARARDAAARWIAELGIKCAGPGQRVAELSGGNQQKVQLARLLHHDVDILLLDEPTRGIDVASKAEVSRLCDRLAAGGKAILLVSSFLPELLALSDRIAVMDRGRLGPARPASDWDAESLLAAAVGA